MEIVQLKFFNQQKRCRALHKTAFRFFFLLLAACGAKTMHADVLNGKVVRLSDGDTVTILDADNRTTRVRLSGIDAPEKQQPFGQQSKINLSRLVFNQDVTVDWHKLDRYGRTVGKIMVRPSDCASCGMTLDVGLAQIQIGLAWWYRTYAKEQTPEDREKYDATQQKARTEQMGLWSDVEPIPPWDWRKKEHAN